MKLPLYEQVALLKDIPDQSLKKGDIVTTVEFLKARDELPNAYVVEVFNALGKTIAVFTVYEEDVEALTDHEVLHVRPILAPTQTIQILDEESVTTDSSPVALHTSTALTIDLSSDLLNQKGITLDEAKLQLALSLFQQDFFSLGKASELSGLHPSQFQKELAKKQISVHYDVDDYQHDLDTQAGDTKSLPTYLEV